MIWCYGNMIILVFSSGIYSLNKLFVEITLLINLLSSLSCVLETRGQSMYQSVFPANHWMLMLWMTMWHFPTLVLVTGWWPSHTRDFLSHRNRRIELKLYLHLKVFSSIQMRRSLSLFGLNRDLLIPDPSISSWWLCDSWDNDSHLMWRGSWDFGTDEVQHPSAEGISPHISP